MSAPDAPFSAGLTPTSSSSLPTARPLPNTTLPGPRAPLEGQQLAKYEALLAHVSAADYALPSNHKAYKAFAKQRGKHHGKPATPSASSSGTSTPTNSADGADGLTPLSDWEKCFLSSEQLQRFLRAVKWDLPNAITRTEVTIVWRREYRTDELGPEDIDEEGKTGKELIHGYDLQGRPLMHMYPYRQNTKTSPRQIQFVVWILERTIDLMPPGVETLCLCIDFGVNGPGQPTPLGQAKATLEILQTYYCERLGRAICVNVPTLFGIFYKLVGPFIDPMTKEKIIFTRAPKDTRNFVDPSSLVHEFGGDSDFVYDHDIFFPAITKLCAERRAAMLERWRKIGNGRPGASEFELRGGAEQAAIFDLSSSSVQTSALAPALSLNAGETHANGETPTTAPTNETSAASTGGKGEADPAVPGSDNAPIEEKLAATKIDDLAASAPDLTHA